MIESDLAGWFENEYQPHSYQLGQMMVIFHKLNEQNLQLQISDEVVIKHKFKT